ncbi:uncharacterized protein mtus1b isoform 2-T5 [Spinachia spinachia]
MANTMVSARSLELGPLGWDTVSKRHVFLRKVSSKLAPNSRQHERGTRVGKGPLRPPPPLGSWKGTGPSGQGSPGPRKTQSDGSTFGEGKRSAGGGTPTRPSPSQCQGIPGIPKTRPTAALLGPATSNSKPTASQQALGQCSVRQLVTPTASKLPEKKLLTSLITSSLDNTINGLKATTVTNANTAKTEATHQLAEKSLTKQVAQYPLQRSSSARLTRINSTVDKNKPLEASARPTNTNTSSLAAAPAGGNSQRKQHPPPQPVPDVVNANITVMAVLPVPTPETTNAGSGTAGASGLGFKAKTGSRSIPKKASRLQNASKRGTAGAVVVDKMVTTKQNQSKELPEKKNLAINQLKKLVVQGNRRVEALAIVIQQLFTESEEALKQNKGLSQELVNLRDELVASSQCCERLQKGKEEVRVTFEEALNQLQEQHEEELVQLENRLRRFYQTEWDKVHQTYQEEADKYRMLMEQQVEELRSRQEADKNNLEVSHSQKMESLRLQCVASMEDLKRIQQTDLENLSRTLKETETSLSEKMCQLSAENVALNEKLKEEERRRHVLTNKNLLTISKDP